MKVLNSGKIWVVAVLAIFSMGLAQAQVNDPCTGALPIACGQTVTGSNTAATNDAVPTCGLSAPRKGVWYTITGTGGMITLTTCSATSNFDTQIAVYSGACTALTCVIANDNDPTCTNYFNRLSRVSFNSTFGTVYRVMVSGKLGSAGTFTLAATCTVVAPANDDCSGAIALTVGSTCTFSQYTTIGATASAGAPAPGCANYAGGDVWFSVVVPSTGRLILDSQTGGITDGGMALYSGTCGALTLIECDDDDSANGLMSFIDRTGLTPGSTVYVRFWEYGNDNPGTFSICAHSPAPPPPSFPDECANAVTLTPGATCVPTNGSTVGATQSIASITCDGFTSSSALDVWYKFVATQANHVVIANGGTTFDVIIDVRSGACNGTNIGCSDSQILSGAAEVESLTGLTVGQTYYIRIYGWAGSTGAFTVCVTNGATSLVDGSGNGVVTLANTDQLQVGDIYPNPAQFGQAFMDIATPQETVASIQLFDQAGRVVRNMETELYSGVNKVELNVNNLAQGTYFAAIRVNNEVFRKKLIVVQ